MLMLHCYGCNQVSQLILVPYQSWEERQCRTPRRPFESIMYLLFWFHFILSYQMCLKLFHKMRQTTIYPSEQLPASYHMLQLKYDHFCTYFPLYAALSYQKYFFGSMDSSWDHTYTLRYKTDCEDTSSRRSSLDKQTHKPTNTHPSWIL